MYRYKGPLLWFLLVPYSQIPLLLNLIFTKFDKHAKLLHYGRWEERPCGIGAHEIKLFYSLLIVLAKECKTQVTQFHSSRGFTESSVIDQKDLYNSDVNGKGNTTGHILWIKSLVAWSKLSHHLKDMLSPGLARGIRSVWLENTELWNPMFLSNANEKSQNKYCLQGHWTLALNQGMTLEKK